MVNNANSYEYVQGLAPYHTPHNMSYQTTTTMDMGILYPNFYQICYPGDKCKLDAEAVVRFNPQVAPLMHEITAKVFWFFVPNRLLWRGDKWWNFWETFITGAVDGTELSEYNAEHPTDPISTELLRDEHLWDPYVQYLYNGQRVLGTGEPIAAVINNVWEAIGLPYKNQLNVYTTDARPSNNVLPLNLVKKAYNQVYNDWFRNEVLQPRVDLKNDILHLINWQRDYLTACAIEQQKGIAPQINLQGLIPVESWYSSEGASGTILDKQLMISNALGYDNTNFNTITGGFAGRGADYAGADPKVGVLVANANNSTGGITVSDLRNLIAVQKALELDMRGGTRYPEYLQANFNNKPKDDRLQRAEYIGMKNFPISVNEVLQTSQTTTDSALGQMGGHALGVLGAGQSKQYYAQEHGVLLGLFVVQPRSQYQQKIPRDLLARDKYDWYRPQFAFLSEQAITQAEVYSKLTDDDNKLFGFQGNFDHMRNRENLVMGLMRADVEQNLSYWNLARYFENEPRLNQEFITCIPRRDFLIVPSQPAMIVTLGWHNYMMRLIPTSSEPGMLDHAYGEGTGQNTMPRLG